MCGGRWVGAEVIMESILLSSELEARRKKRRENRGPVEIARRNWVKQKEVKNGGNQLNAQLSKPSLYSLLASTITNEDRVKKLDS